MRPSTRDAVLQHVKYNPGRTATQIASALGKTPGYVSSVLHTLFEDGAVEHAPKKGPRGGFTYRVPVKGPSSNKTSWTHLLDEDGL